MRWAAVLTAWCAATAVSAQEAAPKALLAGFEGVAVVADAADRRTVLSGEADAVLPWASVTKQVTALLIMQEVKAGRLVLDTPVRTYLPRYKGPNATLKQLLQHTSGLPNPEDGGGVIPPYLLATGPSVGQPGALTLCAGPEKAEPGAGFSYNNCDYMVLGAVLERVTGRPFDKLVSERVTGPLGLRSVRPAADRVAAPVPGSLVLNLAAYGAGANLTGSAADMLTLDRALMEHKLLDPVSTELMWTGEPKLGYVALGAWSFQAPLKGCDKPVRLIERRGAAGSVQIRNVIAPELKQAAVMISTNNSEYGEVWQGRGLTYDVLSAAFCPTA